MRICQFWSPSSADSELGTNHHARVHSILHPDCGKSTRDVVLSAPSGSGGCVFDVLAAPNHTFCSERASSGLNH
jgi:hypothetical protein